MRLTTLTVAVVLLLAGHARANGRFPRAERLVENPSDPDELMLAATYGLIHSADRGRTWAYICEASFAGTDSYIGDPLVDFLGDSSAIVDVQSDLNRSQDQGCTWPSVLHSDVAGILDFTLARGTPDTIVVLSGSFGDGGFVNRLQTASAGSAWTDLGVVPIPTAFTVDVAPSNHQRVYVSGAAADNSGQLLVSDDGGASWLTRPIPNTSLEEQAYIARVHPSDPDQLFVRTDTWNVKNGARYANDALLYSPDAGKTWQELYRAPAKLYGFALSPDSSTLLIGYGDPEPPVPGSPVVSRLDNVDDTVLGLYESPVATFSFQRRTQNNVSCLTWTATGIYACSANGDAQLIFAPGDVPSDAGAFTDLLRLKDVQAPAAVCAQGGNTCALAWQTACVSFGACVDGGTADASPGDAQTPGYDAGGLVQGGTTGASAVPASGGALGSSGSSNAGTGALGAAGANCGCHLLRSRVAGSRGEDIAFLVGICGVFLRRRQLTRTARRARRNAPAPDDTLRTRKYPRNSQSAAYRS